MTPLEKAELKLTQNEKLSRPEAIAANCQVCVGGDIDSGWRQRIKECGVKCYLHAWRPYK